MQTYNFDKKPKIINLKVIILAILILAASAAMIFWCISKETQQINQSAEASQARMLKEQESYSKDINIADSLRKSTADKVYKQESIPNLSYSQIWNMDVSQPSGVTVADLKQVSRGAFVGLEEAFYKAEQDYGVNCLFVMGIASLESADGTICFKPNNMFGYGSSGFSSKAECIDVVSRGLANNYLSPGGGLYSGKRITDVNKRYAASSTWDEKVCRNMARYYSTISQYHNSQLEKLK